MPGPEDKKTSWGGSPKDKTARRRGKGFQVKGQVPESHKTVGNGAKRLEGRRFMRWLFGDDE